MANKPTPPKAAPPSKTATAIYDVLNPIKHDGELYEPGDEIELTDAQAEPLLQHYVQPQAAKT